jgi:hypothetical protein
LYEVPLLWRLSCSSLFVPGSTNQKSSIWE